MSVISIDIFLGVKDEKRSHRGNNLLASDKSIFTTEKELPEVVVEGERTNQEVKKVFGKIEDRGVNNFVFEDTMGVKATRLTTSGRKALESAVNAAGVTPFGSLVATGVQVFSGVADESTALGASIASTELISGSLKGTDVLTGLFKGISSLADKGVIILNQSAILSSLPTREERLTRLTFDFLETSSSSIEFISGKEFEQIIFYDLNGMEGVEEALMILVSTFSALDIELDKQDFDLISDEGYNSAVKFIENNRRLIHNQIVR